MDETETCGKRATATSDIQTTTAPPRIAWEDQPPERRIRISTARGESRGAQAAKRALEMLAELDRRSAGLA